MLISAHLGLPTTRRLVVRGLIALAIAGVNTGPLLAQGRSQLRAGITEQPLNEARRPTLSLQLDQPTHWKEGLIIGTLIGAFAIYEAGVVGMDDFTPRVAIGLLLFGGLVGGVPGALIGGQFPKGPPKAAPMSRVDSH